ncbi:MAG: 50S ribosomal protein L4 [PVC group bacterium]
MTAIEVKNRNGERVDTIELDDSLLEITGSAGIIHDVIRQHDAGARRGTASVKNRSEVSASGRKPWRQKGTGRARAGKRSSPIWRGGGVIFGPQPRSYAFSIPRKVKRKALKSMLAIRFQKGQVLVIDELGLEAPRTKELAGILAALGAEGPALILTTRRDKQIALASRNLPKVTAVGIRDLNTYDVASHQKIVITREALLHLQAWMEKIR